MIRGFYTAGSGIVTQEKKLNNIANNLANASTVGYKRENLVLGTFGEHISVRMNQYGRKNYNTTGDAVYMQIVDDKYTDHGQGGFESTSRPLDMSIMGEGYFVVMGEDGEEYLSRDGQFSLDEEGYLILPGFGRVQGEGGDIELGTSNIGVDDLGNLYVENEDGEAELVDRLIIAIPDDDSSVRKVRNSLYQADDYSEATETDHPTIRQFQLERSNVNMSDEMTRLLESQRALQSCSQIVKMYDDMSDRITTQISRI